MIDDSMRQSELRRRPLYLPYTAEYHGEARVEAKVEVENPIVLSVTLTPALPFKGEGISIDDS